MLIITDQSAADCFMFPLSSLFCSVFCNKDSDCFSNQCCVVGLVCVNNQTKFAGIAVCVPLMQQLTAAIGAIGDALVQFGKNVLKVGSDLARSAARGIYQFFNKVEKSGYVPFDYWRGFIKTNEKFFIRVAVLELTSKSYGLGVANDKVQDNQAATAQKYDQYFWNQGDNSMYW